MKPGENGSAQLRVGKYLLGKLQSDTPQLSKKELMEACAVKEKKTVGAIFRVHFRGMFGIESDDIYPKYGDFEGKDGFLEHLGLIVRALGQPATRQESLRKNAVDLAPRVREGHTGDRWRRI